MAKILTLLVLLMTAVTGAWATDYYVVGTMTDWQKNDQYKMTLNAAAAYFSPQRASMSATVRRS